MLKPVLSIIIISHNQCSELKRCVESILAQRIPFAYELILSDDRSTDGTFELAKEYAEKYSNLIQATQCNSDVCDPANNSQRSGWNRCNGYKLAIGKYIAHVDADDYFRAGSRVYEKQVLSLEKNQECSMALSRVWWLEEGNLENDGKSWNRNRTHPYKDGDVFSASDFIHYNMFIINQAFIQRRNPDVDPITLYGKRYVDAVITYHHMQFGKIVYVEACDYVYVQHKSSVTGQIAAVNHDMDVLWSMGIYISSLMPNYWNMFINNKFDYWSIRRVLDLALEEYKLSKNNQKSIQDINIFIYQCFCKKINIFDKFRLIMAKKMMKFMKRYKLCGHKKLAYILMRLIF